MTKARSNATAEAAKGDLRAGTGTNLSGVLAVGNNGETLVADSSATTGLRWQGNYEAGKNKIINGDMNISQRGTSFTNPTSNTYTLDRFRVFFDGTGGTTQTISQTAFTPGACPTGYEANYYFRWAVTVAGTGNTARALLQDIENVTTFAGQTVTLSFFAKADSARTLQTSYLSQVFGTGGSAQVNQALTFNSTSLTTSWQRFTATVTLPSISGKTIGTSSSLALSIYLPSGTTQTIDIWGVQLEAGSVATPFQTATGTVQGELAACQRYYYRLNAAGLSNFPVFGSGFANTTGNVNIQCQFPETLRIKPTAVDTSTVSVFSLEYGSTAVTSLTSISIDTNYSSPDSGALAVVKAASFVIGTVYRLTVASSNAAFIGWSAEL